MANITITKKEYQKLREKAVRYDYIQEVLREDDIFSPPPTKDAKDIVGKFKATKKYNRKFLESLERGLGRSSYFNETSTAPPRNRDLSARKEAR